jgi:acyl-CoA reductase-like NAD-dependent aldehyde dehydrogenase
MSANRVLVHEEIFDEFVDSYVAKVASLQVGDPREEATVIGPLINSAQAETLNHVVDEAIKQGARAALRGTVAGGLFDPVVLVDVTPDMHVAQTELFGPVVCMIPFGDDDEAVHCERQLLRAQRRGAHPKPGPGHRAGETCPDRDDPRE